MSNEANKRVRSNLSIFRKLPPALLLENETKIMEKKLNDLRKSIQREKQMNRWTNPLTSTSSFHLDFNKNDQNIQRY